MKMNNILWLPGISLMALLSTTSANAQEGVIYDGVVEETSDVLDDVSNVDMEDPIWTSEDTADLGNIADTEDNNESAPNDGLTNNDLDNTDNGKDKEKDKNKNKFKDKSNAREMNAINTLIKLNCDPEQIVDFVAYMDCAASYAQGYEGVALIDVLDKKNLNNAYSAYSNTFMDLCLATAGETARATFDNASPDWHIAYTESAIRCTEFESDAIADEDISETLKSLVQILNQ
jgi:hypothetical protein